MDTAEDLKQRLTTTLRVAQALTLCFIVPIFMYPLAAISVLGEGRFGPGFHGHSRLLSLLVVLFGVLIIFNTGRITQFFLKRLLRQQLSQPDTSKLIAAYLLTVVVSGTLREFVALLGVFLSILEKNLFWCVLLGILAFFALARSWPNRKELETLFPQVRF